MTSTALIGVAPTAALAADKIVDGVQETISSPKTFDNVTVGDTQPASELDVVSDGELSVDQDLTVGNKNGSEGTLTISNDGIADVAGEVFVGKGVGASGTVTISGINSSLTTNDDVHVGEYGQGALNVLVGGKANVGVDLIVGTVFGATGTVTVSGSGSKLTVNNDLVLGRAEDFIGGVKGDVNTLSVVDGGEAAANEVSIGERAGSEGRVTVSGSGSKLTADARVDVGRAGSGALLVLDGGYVDTGNSFSVGRDGSGVGSVTISGSGSKAVNGFATYIGDSGKGALTISNGGELDGSDVVFFGFAAGSEGTGTVTGSGSKLTAQNLSIGREGNGTVTVSNGGLLESEGSLSIASGADSTSTLNILDGGEATTGNDVTVGSDAGSNGTVTISGSGSKLSVGDDVFVGRNGTGEMTVTDGGEVTVDSFFFTGFSSGSEGTVTISGPGSRLDVDGGMYVGRTGTGTLAVENGGHVEANIFTIASGGKGTVTVSGSGSTLAATGDRFSVGAGGDATLNVIDGGSATSAGSVHIAEFSDGTVTISGGGSRLVAADNIHVGEGTGNTGTLTISGGGVAEAGDKFIIAQYEVSVGTLNIGAASGDPAAAAGKVTGDNGAAADIVFGAGTGEIVFNHTETDYAFDANVSGTGNVSQEAGYTNLTGDFSAFTGTGTVSGGTLSVDTAFGGAMSVLSGGTLTGSGSVGSILFSSGSIYHAEIDGTGTLTSTGAVTIASGSKLDVGFGDTSNVAIWQPITVLSGASISGTFDTTNEDDYLFLDFGVDYTSTSVDLNVDRNGVAFSSIAETSNQKSVAATVDGLPFGNDVYDAFSVLTSAEDARNALDQLSGEIHASTQGAMIGNAGFAGSAIGSRFDTGAGDGTKVLSEVDIGDGSPPVMPPDQLGAEIWGQTYGSFGSIGGNGNAARQDTLSGGLFVGAETDDFYGFRAGVLAGYGKTRNTVDALNSSADIDSFTFGAYAGRDFGAVRTRLGATYAVNAVGSQRDVAFGNLTETVTADYLSRTFQALGEVGYQFGDDAAWLEPFVGVELLNLQTDGFTETGGAAALKVDGTSQTLGVATLGIRAGGKIATTDDGTEISYKAALGWRHAFGELASQTNAAFAAGGQSFTVSGVPIDQDVATIEVGFDFDFTGPTDLSLTYRGDFGQHAQNNSVSARLASKF